MPFMQEVVRIYNQYSAETDKQWTKELEALFGSRLSRVTSPIDADIFTSLKKVPLILYPTGSFYLISSTESEDEGCVVPLPWLQFNNTTVTDQLKPFYDLPESDNQGIIERLEKPAHVTNFLRRTRYELKPTPLSAYRGKEHVELSFLFMKDKLTEMGVEAEGTVGALVVPKAYERPAEEAASSYGFEVAKKTKADIWTVIEKGVIRFR